MRRRNPAVSPERATALWRKSAPVQQATVTAECQLVTPMYGGGVEVGKIDLAMPIRASALRGQLRFWWRLLYGGDRNSADVFKKECALWGGISREGPQASQVSVRVDCAPVSPSQLIDARHREIPGYGLILDRDKPPPKLLKDGYQFEVTLEFQGDAEKMEVVEALRWWASFAGLGARTRRGFGAVRASLAGGDADFAPVTPAEVEARGGCLVLGQQAKALSAWKDAVGALQSFRQVGVGRRRGPTGPSGSNRWPEAGTIRRLAGETGPRRSSGEANLFPRAAFGLPIVFQFKGEEGLNDTLEGEHHERMASPLILRPYFDGDDFRPMALLLPDWRERISVAVKLRDRGRKGWAWPVDEAERNRLADEVGPMAERGSDPLTAFMHYFEQRTGTKGAGG